MAHMNRIPLKFQELALRSYFPKSTISRVREDRITWISTITPTPFSRSYKVKLEYVRGEGVKFFVLDPKLMLAEGKTVLPHVYSSSEQRLCLYDPDLDEWDASCYYVQTIIPWASEWLLHYELWLHSGDWLGGGRHPVIESAKAEKKEFEDTKGHQNDHQSHKQL